MEKVDPQASVRSRSVQPPSNRSKERNDVDVEKARKETVCTVVAHELDPRSLAKWPRLFVRSVFRVGQVVATFRFITFSDVIAGLLNTALLFTFAAVFASAIFGDVGLSNFVALGTGCNLITTVVVQGAFAVFSDVGVNIAGPDVNPAIFLATIAGLIRQAMINKLESQIPDIGGRTNTYTPTGSPVPHGRLLKETAHTLAPSHPDVEVVLDADAFLATVLAAIIITTVMFGSFIYVLGRLKVSRAVQLVPGSVLAGFMASIGYLVILKALKTSMPHEVWDEGPGVWEFWAFFLPAVPIGVAMYLQKRWHIGSPVVLLPIILVVPLAIFFIAVYASGSDIEVARTGGWLFPAFQTEKFYTQFVDSYGKAHLVDWESLSVAVPTMIVMLFIVTVDSLLKQASIRKILKAHDLRIDHELMLLGKSNIVAGFLVGVCGYPQPKLVAINYGVVRNTTSRVSGMIVVFLNGLLFFLGFPLINYLPRFWLGGVLLFAAAGFIVENLWDARLKFSRKEYVSIWAIVIVNAIFGLAWAVLCGVVLSALIFAMAYSRGGAIKSVISGTEYRSSVVRNAQEDLKLQHIGTKAVVIQLHRYVFFGSAAYVNEVVNGLIKEQDLVASEEKRALYFVFDWAHVEDVDVTALDVLMEMLSKLLVNDAGAAAGGHGHGSPSPSSATAAPTTALTTSPTSAVAAAPKQTRIVLFTGLDPKLRKKMAGENLIQLLHEPEYRANAGLSTSATEDEEKYHILGKHKRCFDTLDRGMEFVEERLLQWSWEARKRWFKFESFKDFHFRAKLYRQTFEQVLAEELGEEYLRYVEPISVPKGWSLCRAGDLDPHLYLLQEGSLTAYIEIPGGSENEEASTSRLQTLRHGAFINEDAVYVERPIVPYTVIADVDSVVLAISKENINRLDQLHPALAIDVHRQVLKHAAKTKMKIVRMLGSLGLWDKEQAAMGSSSSSARVEPSQNSLGDESALEEGIGGIVIDSTNSNRREGFLGTIQDVTSDAFHGVTSTTTSVFKEVSSTTVAALQTGLILSGFREDDKDDDEKDLLSTTQLRDGAGELSGRRFAQQLGAKNKLREISLIPEEAGGAVGGNGNDATSPRALRRHSSVGNPVVNIELIKSVRTVQDYRSIKGALEHDAVNAIFKMLPSSSNILLGGIDVSTVALRLNENQLLNARTVFARAANEIPRAPRGGSSALSMGGGELPRSKVRDCLGNLGLIIPEGDREFSDPNDPVPLTEAEFINLITRLTFVQLPSDFLSRCAALFEQLTEGNSDLLTESTIRNLVQGVSGYSISRFLQKWMNGNAGVDLSGFCSALAQHYKSLQLDEQIQADWSQLRGENEFVRAEDVARVFGCSLLEAQEMIWEADFDNNGVLYLFDLLDTLSAETSGA